MKTADLPQDTEKLSHTPEYPAKTTDLPQVIKTSFPGENYRPDISQSSRKNYLSAVSH
jgi:hypothetical protein